MVLKLGRAEKRLLRMFESSVNSDGTQTIYIYTKGTRMFESSVNSDGTQTP